MNGSISSSSVGAGVVGASSMGNSSMTGNLVDELDLEAVWTRAIASLGDDVLPAQHRAWMRLTKPLALVQDTAVMATPNDFDRELLDTQIRDVIIDALFLHLGSITRVVETAEPEQT